MLGRGAVQLSQKHVSYKNGMGIPCPYPHPLNQDIYSHVWKYAHSSFSSLMQSLLPKDTLLRTYVSRF